MGILLFCVLFLLVTVEAVFGFLFAEVFRLTFLARWTKTKPQYRLAWIAGFTLYAVNLASVLLDRVADIHLTTPTSDVDLLQAVLVYPLFAGAIWAMLLYVRAVLYRAHGADPHR